MEIETNQQQQGYVESLLQRLWEQYRDFAPLPDREHEEALSLHMLQRLYRHILSEGYGE
jgi:hypothetical protein